MGDLSINGEVKKAKDKLFEGDVLILDVEVVKTEEWHKPENLDLDVVYEDEDVYRQTTDRWCIMMCPGDIKALGNVSEVTIQSDQGEMANVSVVPFDLPPGNCMCYYPEANVLTGTAVDPRSKTPGFKSTAVTLVPVVYS